ncbi:MAG TPA: hypothetical protein DCZ06_13170, partial [Alphaproteobacteria bacterium]|nr:hypothetical protein [Alphaproteobacteria bacterium]
MRPFLGLAMQIEPCLDLDLAAAQPCGITLVEPGKGGTARFSRPPCRRGRGGADPGRAVLLVER